jgi:hypothetical protein
MHTGSRAFCILMALTATGSEVASAATVASEHYRVEAKMISVSGEAVRDFGGVVTPGYISEERMVKLIENPRTSTLSLPSVEAKESLPSHIDVTREVPLPHGAAREAGISLDIVPRKQGADLGFQVSLKDIRFQGFQDRSATIPLFHTGRVTTSIPASAQAPTGYYCISVPVPQKLATYDADGRRSASIADANERELLFVKISRG